MTPTQEVTAEEVLRILVTSYQLYGNFQPTPAAHEAKQVVRDYITQSAAKIAGLTQLVTDARNAGTEKHNRLVEAKAENARLRSALEKISRMTAFPDAKINRTTLVAARELARSALQGGQDAG